MKDVIHELDLHHGGVIVSTLRESVHVSEEKKREPPNSVSPHPEERTRRERPPLWRGVGVGAAVDSGCNTGLLFFNI